MTQTIKSSGNGSKYIIIFIYIITALKETYHFTIPLFFLSEMTCHPNLHFTLIAQKIVSNNDFDFLCYNSTIIQSCIFLQIVLETFLGTVKLVLNYSLDKGQTFVIIYTCSIISTFIFNYVIMNLNDA